MNSGAMRVNLLGTYLAANPTIARNMNSSMFPVIKHKVIGGCRLRLPSPDLKVVEHSFHVLTLQDTYNQHVFFPY
uniref:AlNc14C201G8693 protein n=2 Tax=Albugo laibachii Nc14 TaxID=890382 RepID=F0WQN1_9STRA|nr:AlNc14C201G8693 [Albugo laibachii Nc14]|eukprot:CCA23640.1 AlNc14C201G8693 [Albugo laibachii Nc14]